MVDAYQGALRLEGLAEENLQARVRGTTLMAISNAEGHLVLATGNKSELATGYSTLYGDAVGGYAPLKDIPKTWVWRIARWRNGIAYASGAVAPIPENSIDKPPSAELRPGQLDSDVDGTGNACDNCNGRFNPGQEDDDADGVGNACDNCLAVSDPNQADPDGDLRGTPCDNCATTANADQADADADGIGNACDPACANGLDDDADGFTDYPADIACHDAGGFNENPRCDDGIDNDNDGFADHDGAGLGDPDPHCVAKPWRDNEGPDSACGLGFEMAPLLLGIAALRRRRGRC